MPAISSIARGWDMKIVDTLIGSVLVVSPTVHGDDRGFFFEAWNQARFRDIVGQDVRFVQDNHSRSARGVLRGIHYQLPSPQAKLVRVVHGVVWDVAVDLRRSSKTFMQWAGVELTSENHHQLWIPEGFGHGFVVLSESADVVYKTSAYYDGVCDRVIRYDDQDLAIEWPLTEVVLSTKDAAAPPASEALLFD